MDDTPVPINTAPSVLSKAGNEIDNPLAASAPVLADMMIARGEKWGIGPWRSP